MVPSIDVVFLGPLPAVPHVERLRHDASVEPGKQLVYTAIYQRYHIIGSMLYR